MFEFYDKDRDSLRIYSEDTETVNVEAAVWQEDPKETVVNTIFVKREDALDVAKAVLTTAEIKADIIPYSESSVQENEDGSLDCEGLITEGCPTPEVMRNTAAKALKVARFLEERQERDRTDVIRNLMPNQSRYQSFASLPPTTQNAVDEIVRLRYELKRVQAKQ